MRYNHSKSIGGRDANLRAEIELVAAIAKLPLELPQRLVFLVAHAGDRHIELDADLRDRPAAHPELDDPILASSQYRSPGGFQNLAELELISLRRSRSDAGVVDPSRGWNRRVR